jgi:hypothetical protein
LLAPRASKCQSCDHAHVPDGMADGLAGGGVPEPGGIVIAPCEDQFSVGAECHGLCGTFMGKDRPESGVMRPPRRQIGPRGGAEHLVSVHIPKREVNRHQFPPERKANRHQFLLGPRCRPYFSFGDRRSPRGAGTASIPRTASVSARKACSSLNCPAGRSSSLCGQRTAHVK